MMRQEPGMEAALSVHDDKGTMVVMLTMSGLVIDGSGRLEEVNGAPRVIAESLRELWAWRTGQLPIQEY